MYLHIATSSNKEDIFRVPIQAKNSASNGFLDMFRDPPVVLLFKVANRNESSSASDSKLVFQRRPFDMRGSSINSEENQCGFPVIHRGIECPNVGISVLGTSH
jgi:hypothetical protein